MLYNIISHKQFDRAARGRYYNGGGLYSKCLEFTFYNTMAGGRPEDLHFYVRVTGVQASQ